MSTMSLRLPESLHDRLREVADQENVSMNQIVTMALAEKLSVLDAEQYLSERAERGTREKFERALGKVADGEPPEYDRE